MGIIDLLRHFLISIGDFLVAVANVSMDLYFADQSEQILKLFNASDESSLITTTPRIKNIIRNHHLISTSEAKSDALSLAFVDVKNNQGLRLAIKLARKFSHLSPRWLLIKLDENNDDAAIISGIYDIDYKWIQEVKNVNPSIKILPTLTFNDWYPSHLIILLTNGKLTEYIGKQLADLAEKFKLDGFVIDIWTAFAAQQKYDAAQFMIRLSSQLRKNKLFTMLLIPPPLHYGGRLGLFLKEDAERLAPYLHGFIVKTYDYSNIQRPGPNSPIKWLKECVLALCPNAKSTLRRRLFLGINFHGYIYDPTGGHEIAGNEYVSILQHDKPKLTWDELSEEHYIEYRTYLGRHRVFYPTLASFYRRLKLSQDLGTSIAISDIGAGLNYFSFLL